MAGLLLYCKCNDEFTPIVLDDHILFTDIVRVVCDRFGFSRNSVSLCYVIRGQEKCYLRNEEDLKGMVCLFRMLGEKIVNIVVADSSIVLHKADCSVGSSSVLDEIEYDVEETSSSTRKIYKTSSWTGCITDVGQIFRGGSVEFKNALRKFCIVSKRDFLFQKNTEKRVVAVCRSKWISGCEWSIEASYKVFDKVFMIRSFNKEHCCEAAGPTDANKRVNSDLLASIVKEMVRETPDIRPKNVKTNLRVDYGLHISYYKAWLAIEKAKGLNIGSVADSYKQLESYIEAVKATNPGSNIALEVDESGGTRSFKRAFFAFAGCIEGFKSLRPMLFIDGTFLKGKFKGVLLSAVGKNGNKGLFPLAFAVVDSENLVNWEWFLEKLREVVGLDRPLTFFSDRHLGLLEAMKRVFPASVHCYCLKHLKDNLKTKFGGGDVFFANTRNELVRLLGECANAETVPLFELKRKELIDLGGVKVEDFLSAIPVDKWTHAYRPVCCYGETTSNAVESFNSWILEIRNLPLTEMIDQIRIKLMDWFDARKTLSGKWKGVLCEFYQKKWDDYVHDGLSWVVRRASSSKFEVCSQPTESVDLAKRECSCHRWQIDGFPCAHAVFCIASQNLRIQDYVEEYFFAETYRKSYAVPINPVPTSMWRDSQAFVKSKLLPPCTKRQPGRPKNKRIPSWGEIVSSKKLAVRCGTCKKYGHNRRTCKEPV